MTKEKAPKGRSKELEKVDKSKQNGGEGEKEKIKNIEHERKSS